MNEKFLQWANQHIEELTARGIVSEIPDLSREAVEKKLQNPCQIVYYYSRKHIGFVSVWQTGVMDIEIANIDTGQLEDYHHFDDIKDSGFDDILEDFFQKLM